jgi:single-strand DNA-binding protein
MKNHWSGIGRLGRDPKIVTTRGGRRLARFSLGCDHRWWDRQAREQRKATEWVPCVAWGGLADVVERLCRKGTLVSVEGRFTTSSWDDKTTGQKRYSSEVNVGELWVLDRARRQEQSARAGEQDLASGGAFGEEEDFGDEEEFGGGEAFQESGDDQQGGDGDFDDDAPF